MMTDVYPESRIGGGPEILAIQSRFRAAEDAGDVLAMAKCLSDELHIRASFTPSVEERQQYLAARADDLTCFLDGQRCFECGDFERSRYCGRPTLCPKCQRSQYLRYASIAEQCQSPSLLAYPGLAGSLLIRSPTIDYYP